MPTIAKTSQSTRARAAGTSRHRTGLVRTELTLAEHTCLALIAQGVSHGWALGSLLAPEGEIGRIWSLTRPLTYRAVDQLLERSLVSRRGNQPGHGRERRVVAATAAGKRAAAAWLAAPVQHLRDVRTELLVKIALRERAGEPVEPLLEAQHALFTPAIDALTTTEAGGNVVDLWRRESARAVRRFLDHVLHPSDLLAPQKEKLEMRLSARNQLHGTVNAVTHGEVMSTVKVALPDGQSITAAITKEAAEDLDLATGDNIIVIIKATEVIVAKPD